MFGVTTQGALRTHQRTVPEWRGGAVKLASRTPAVAHLDVRCMDWLPALLETKSSQRDAWVIQQAVCQQFHWLVARQILFRRKYLG